MHEQGLIHILSANTEPVQRDGESKMGQIEEQIICDGEKPELSASYTREGEGRLTHRGAPSFPSMEAPS